KIGQARGGYGSMKDGKILFPATLLAMILAAGAARGGSITHPDLDPVRSESTFGALAAGLLDLPSVAIPSEDLASTDLTRQDARLIVGTVDPSPISADQPLRVPEPTSMGLFGIGITSLITLRRFRKYFS
ncbi:hypothetical protein HK102_008757, partial [Quaeritorhiza haematococci]